MPTLLPRARSTEYEVDLIRDPFPLKDARDLTDFLARQAGQSDGCYTFPQLAGFLFPIVNGPELFMPSDWLDEVLVGVVFESHKDASDVMGWIMALSNAVLSDPKVDPAPLPYGLILNPEPLANFDPECAATAWSRGFMKGHAWVADVWEEWLPEEVEVAHINDRFALGFFSSRTRVEKAIDHPDEPLTLAQMAEGVCRSLPVAAGRYAAFGRLVYRARRKDEEAAALPHRADSRPGRNQPCPCGSGRKFKRCCGAG